MVKSCCAIKCTNRFKKGSSITFHSFPLRNSELLKQWCRALGRKNFIPSRHHSLCSQHFNDDAFLKGYVNIQKLKDDAVPTKFKFADQPSSCSKKWTTEQSFSEVIKKKKTNKERSLHLECNPVPELTKLVEHMDSSVEERSLTTTEYSPDDHSYGISDSPHEIKIKFEHILKRKEKQLEANKVKLKLANTKILRLQRKIESMETTNIKQRERYINNNNYTPVAKDVIERLQKGDRSGEYSDNVQLFALTLYSCSPIAYDFVRESLGFCLPHLSTVCNWRKNIDSKPADNTMTF